MLSPVSFSTRGFQVGLHSPSLRVARAPWGVGRCDFAIVRDLELLMLAEVLAGGPHRTSVGSVAGAWYFVRPGLEGDHISVSFSPQSRKERTSPFW